MSSEELGAEAQAAKRARSRYRHRHAIPNGTAPGEADTSAGDRTVAAAAR